MAKIKESLLAFVEEKLKSEIQDLKDKNDEDVLDLIEMYEHVLANASSALDSEVFELYLIEWLETFIIKH